MHGHILFIPSPLCTLGELNLVTVLFGSAVPDRMVFGVMVQWYWLSCINYRYDVIFTWPLVTQFCWQMVCRRFGICGEGGRLESPTGSDLTVFQWSTTQVTENHCTQLIRVCLAPGPSAHLLWRRFSLGTETSPPFLALNCPNTLYLILPRFERHCFN